MDEAPGGYSGLRHVALSLDLADTFKIDRCSPMSRPMLIEMVSNITAVHAPRTNWIRLR